ncbi:MAG: hypothetical protein H6828_16090 [Planctomycetes bacterium]|nr:hypothetical protein [Planctomycetota bacterium]
MSTLAAARDDAPAQPALTTAAVLRTWWPLAASWLLMGAELPLLSAVVARLAEPNTHLAAFGSVVFPVSLLIEAPVIMMLAASVALSRDRAAFERLRRFALSAGVLLSSLHALIAFTPLFDLLVVGAIDPPPEVVEPARLGFRLIAPWTLMIADRRFHQGVLIRHGHSRAVGIGTLVRLFATGSTLLVGWWLAAPGCALACSALVVGVTSEMLFARAVVSPVVKRDLLEPGPHSEPLTLARLLAFYVPLALTPLLNLAAQPLGSATMSRAPLALESMAVWPVVFGLIFVLRAVGIAFNEVVVSHAGEPGATRVLGRFALVLALACVALLTLVAATPLGHAWFVGVAGLEPALADLAAGSLWFGLLLPAMTAAHSYYQGRLVHAHRTRGVTESVGIFLVVTATLLWLGERATAWPGVQIALGAFTCGSTAQALWLAVRARGLARTSG